MNNYRRAPWSFSLLCVGLLALSAATSSHSDFRISSIALGREQLAPPPEVPHDGVHVIQPLDPNNCKAPGSKSSFLQVTPAATPAQSRQQQRTAFACAAGCSKREPQLEQSLAPWAEWKRNTSGLHVLRGLEAFCHAQRESTDPWVMFALWQGDVYVKACRIDSLERAALYLIGPEDLSMALIMFLGSQKVAKLPEGPIAFGMYLSDYSSLLDHHLIGPGLPIFSYLSRETSWLVPFPSSFTILSAQDTEELEKQHKVAGTKQKAWEARTDKAYWIGAVTGPWEFQLDDTIEAVPRVKLLRLAHENPSQLHAEWSSTAGYGITWIHDDENVSGILAEQPRAISKLTGIAKSDYKTADQWENYKYYVNLDGVVMGGRLTKLLSLGGVVLQHKAGYSEHVSALLKPYEHYVPIEYDLSDLVSKIQWLQKNDAEAKRIAANAKALAEEHMRMEDHICYTWRLLESLGTRTASAPVSSDEVAAKLKDFKRVRVEGSSMRQTLESFWGTKLEETHTGGRYMTDRGIRLLDWTWKHYKELNERIHSDGQF